MIIKNNTAIVFTLAIILATGIVVSSSLNSAIYAQNGKFSAKLSGQEEVPPTDSKATGMAEFTPTGESVSYTVNATDIQGVTAGHIHSGEEGKNGEVVVTLFKFDSAQNQVSENGTITSDKLEGPMQGKQISDLEAAMKNGTTYVNIHTEQNPNGEIRGQIMSSNP
ncbi:MAG: CHRD domain-containing protein [Nitrosopumilus sp.]|nr:CHRD domain-containing protein [Nitrosopumilus sp.]